jgi:hypothetical protein
MVCRHTAGDPSCTTRYPNRDDYTSSSTPAVNTPNPSEYKIKKFHRVGPHVVISAQYPSCRDCSYEGIKVLVFLDVTEVQIMTWRKIDPHFRDPSETGTDDMAPSPAARFPASEEGFDDAIAYAQSKCKKMRRKANEF